MKAMILAAGVGSRLDPLTRNVPKPMVPIVNRPVIEHIIDKLKKHGFDEIMVNLHYLGDIIKDHLGDGSKLGVKLAYALEDQLWGDAGSVKRSEEFLKGDTFIVVGGDDISDINLTELLQFHKAKKAVSTLALSLVDDPSEYGIVLTDDDGRITKFLEKPKGQVVFSNTANTGVYVFEPEVFDIIPTGASFGFGHNVFPRLLEEDKPMYGYITSAYWKDVGNLQVYRKTNFDALTGVVALNMGGDANTSGVRIGSNPSIDATAEISGPSLIGDNVTIGAGSKILPNSIIGNNVKIGANATVSNSILWDNAQVNDGTLLERTIIGRDATVQTNYGVFDGVVVNPNRGS